MSAILSADDLNDFISPGVACIKPIETLPAAPPPAAAHNGPDEVILDGQGTSGTTGGNGAATPAEISLTDCLACSGCVTSAEAVLVSLQSHAEVLSMLDAAPALRVVQSPRTTNGTTTISVEGLEDENAKLFVVSVSPQVRANLAAACGPNVSEKDAGCMLENLFRGPHGLARAGTWNNGFTWVLDTNVAREAGLVLGADEVMAAKPGAASSSQPILASSCPGWVCYAEKTHPHVLPYMSKVKSPQALMGTILKTTLSRRLEIPPSRIWHLAVMPCFDKKLEASREELTDAAWNGTGFSGRGVRDVDCVITSKEILMLAESRGLNFFDIPKVPTCSSNSSLFPDPQLRSFLFPSTGTRNSSRQAGTSGGLLYHMLQSKAAVTPGAEIETKRGRNADVVEYAVLVNGEPVFKAARYYGFRNIQNLVRRLKPARPSRMPGGKPFGSAKKPTGKSQGLEYNYVEVMACPGGCTNGGGQIKVDDQIIIERKGTTEKPGPQEQKSWLSEVDEAYFSGEEYEVENSGQVVDGISHAHIHDILAHWSAIAGTDLDRLALTSYREVISDVGKDKTTDTERVVQLAGKIGGGW
jgi:iron only hydrogenase large subunit-like protein